MITRETKAADLSALLRVSEVATHLDVSEGTVRAEIKAGRLKHVQVGRLVRVSREDLSDWMKR